MSKSVFIPSAIKYEIIHRRIQDSLPQAFRTSKGTFILAVSSNMLPHHLNNPFLTRISPLHSSKRYKPVPQTFSYPTFVKISAISQPKQCSSNQGRPCLLTIEEIHEAQISKLYHELYDEYNCDDLLYVDVVVNRLARINFRISDKQLKKFAEFIRYKGEKHIISNRIKSTMQTIPNLSEIAIVNLIKLSEIMLTVCNVNGNRNRCKRNADKSGRIN